MEGILYFLNTLLKGIFMAEFKSKLKSTSNPQKEVQKQIRTIIVGEFYLIHDGSQTGHPGLVVSKDDNANRYLIVRFDSDKKGDVPKISRGVRHITRLNYPTEDKVVASYVKNRPLLCKRKDIGKRLTGLK